MNHFYSGFFHGLHTETKILLSNTITYRVFITESSQEILDKIKEVQSKEDFQKKKYSVCFSGYWEISNPKSVFIQTEKPQWAFILKTLDFVNKPSNYQHSQDSFSFAYKSTSQRCFNSKYSQTLCLKKLETAQTEFDLKKSLFDLLQHYHPDIGKTPCTRTTQIILELYHTKKNTLKQKTR